MNKLDLNRRVQIVKALCEGNSLRSTARMTGVAVNTVVKLLTELGSACLDYQDKVMRNLTCQKLQCDEIWSFVYSKAKNVPAEHEGQFGYGDVWTFVAIDADTKLTPCWHVGARDAENACDFINDLKGRLANRVQLTTDGHKMYLNAVENAFGSEIDFAQLVKLYGETVEGQRRYSPAQCTGTIKTVIQGNPDESKVSTSYIERQNLTMRMSMRRFTRLTNAFSKKLENHMYALALYFFHYNFVRTHKSLANPYPRTPAMAAGVTNRIWSFEDVIGLLG
ncbi:IS1 family transposase [Dehalogenimonas etheniformans]|uniref:IS1 family transposase n=1 Tax=Dehalogenimonas etheniformans TaxID=1536648 RepID=A0A2P5P7J3_9CHLR|nr:IS1 family transposase [Dehalogenimonas etheniformans]PPD58249.1 IS1 family transposase [Dehalogenimonas etheniformans]QNT75658.1 IS1 family transposase [Dehalogenimonas etheniformans]